MPPDASGRPDRRPRPAEAPSASWPPGSWGGFTGCPSVPRFPAGRSCPPRPARGRRARPAVPQGGLVADALPLRRQDLLSAAAAAAGFFARVDAGRPQGVALQLQRLRALGLRDAGVADQRVSKVATPARTGCDTGADRRGPPGAGGVNVLVRFREPDPAVGRTSGSTARPVAAAPVPDPLEGSRPRTWLTTEPRVGPDVGDAERRDRLEPEASALARCGPPCCRAPAWTASRGRRRTGHRPRARRACGPAWRFPSQGRRRARPRRPA